MSLLQFLLVQLFLIAFYLVYKAISSGKQNYQLNRWFLLLLPPTAMVLPFYFGISSQTSTLPWIAELPAVNVLRSSALYDGTATIPWHSLIIGIGVLISVVLFVLQLVRLLGTPKVSFIKYIDGYNVYLTSEKVATHSFFRNIYINPSDLPNQDIIILHEYAHCKEGHSFDSVLMAVYKSIFWFNPVIYLWANAVRENHEFIADHYVLTKGIPAKNYGEVLLAANFNVQTPILSNTFHSKSLLLKRIEKFNHKNQYHMKQLIIIPMVAGMAFLSASMQTTTAPDQVKKVAGVEKGGDEEAAQFPGGQEAMSAFITKEVKYPKELLNDKISGTVYLSFDISALGKVENVQVTRSSGYAEMDDEAMRVIKAMPDWEPAHKGDKAVKSSLNLPFRFAV